MPFMLKGKTLRKEPNGEETLSSVEPGNEVEILEESQGWTKIKRKALTGWVLSTAVGNESPVAPETTIDKQEFFGQCWREGLISGVFPHYLAAVAKVRSDITNALTDPFGPFRLTKAEWDAGRKDPALRLTDFDSGDIKEWDFQLAMFGAVVARDFEALKTGLGRPPSAHELYLAQLIGAKAAAAAVKKPDDTIQADLAGVSDADLPMGGMTRDQIATRYAKYLLDPGPPPVSVKGSVALERIANDLQAALDAVKDDIIKAGTDVLSVEPDPEQIIPDAKKPGPGKLPDTAGPAGPAGPAAIPGAGGALGKLVAAHESGKAGYNAFNRGFAGDSHGQKLDFSTMTLAAIMAEQAKPKTDRTRLFAVGKYQLIPGTMKAAVASLKLDTSRKLTPDVQESLFRNYLVAVKRPNVKNFITGKGASLHAAQLALALEFASFGDPNMGGRSHYGGSGGNRASVSLQQAADALNAERTKYQANIAAGMSPDQAWNALSA